MGSALKVGAGQSQGLAPARGDGQEPSLLQAPGQVALTRHSLEWGGCPLVLDGVPEQCGVLEVSPGLGVPLEPPSSLGGPLGPF